MEKTEMDNSTATSTTSIDEADTELQSCTLKGRHRPGPFIRSFTGEKAAGTANGEIETQS